MAGKKICNKNDRLIQQNPANAKTMTTRFSS